MTRSGPYQCNEEAIAGKAGPNGKFLIQTNTSLSALEAVQAYKGLQRVEHAFRELKNSLRLRPIYHWKEDRVRGPVFMCLMAYLFEHWMEALYCWHIEAQVAQVSRLRVI